MLTLGTTTSCSDFLDESPKGVIDKDKAFSRPTKWLLQHTLCSAIAGILIHSTFGHTVIWLQTIVLKEVLEQQILAITLWRYGLP